MARSICLIVLLCLYLNGIGTHGGEPCMDCEQKVREFQSRVKEDLIKSGVINQDLELVNFNESFGGNKYMIRDLFKQKPPVTLPTGPELDRLIFSLNAIDRDLTYKLEPSIGLCFASMIQGVIDHSIPTLFNNEAYINALHKFVVGPAPLCLTIRRAFKKDSKDEIILPPSRFMELRQINRLTALVFDLYRDMGSLMAGGKTENFEDIGKGIASYCKANICSPSDIAKFKARFAEELRKLTELVVVLGCRVRFEVLFHYACVRVTAEQPPRKIVEVADTLSRTPLKHVHLLSQFCP